MIYIVSGLPRSGTSMLMKMLEAGGIEILTDYRRTADVDNPKGYFEYEAIKKLAEDAEWINHIEAKGIKVISHLLPYLPRTQSYKVLFVLRPIEEVMLSQARMLERTGDTAGLEDQDKLARKFKDHLYTIRLWIAKQAHMECLFIKYRDIINAPQEYAEKISAFIQVPCNIQAMADVVDSRLYRNKITS
ncbi:MAG: sulfotransferase domain-containing protein [Desulfobacterales bacterium]|nr:sulfotransferase domain-containing protein [Desulfobacterales bacterium]